jgi:hypothetical protein
MVTMNTKIQQFAWSLAFAVCLAAGVSGQSNMKPINIQLEPVVLDSKNGAAATTGIEYSVNGKLTLKKFATNDTGVEINPDVSFGSAVVSYSGTGTVTPSPDRNPINFMNFLARADFLYSTASSGTVQGGAFAKYECTQNFTDKQFVYGLGATYAKYPALLKNDYVVMDAAYGRVDPTNDNERQGALDGAELKAYYRWNLEFLYKYTISDSSVIKTFEFNYRYFFENGAPDAIKRAGLDKHDLATFRLGMSNDLYVAYSTGKLPFDREKDQIIQIGFSYNLK